MVPLDKKISIENSLMASPKANALLAYLNTQKVIIPNDDLTEGENNYYGLLDALRRNDKKGFNKIYDEQSKRKLVGDQPFIYDNFMLFTIIVGIIKFNLNDDWIRSVLSLRTTANNPENLITSSFLNILSQNYLSTGGIPSIVLAGLVKSKDELLSSTLVKNSFESNNQISNFLERDLFLSCIYLFTSKYIISISIGEDSVQLKKFESTFLKRVELLQNFMYAAIVIGLFAAWFFLIKHNPKIKDIVNDVDLLLQLLGIGFFAVLLNFIKKRFGDAIKSFFGYFSKSINGNK